MYSASAVGLVGSQLNPCGLAVEVLCGSGKTAPGSKLACEVLQLCSCSRLHVV